MGRTVSSKYSRSGWCWSIRSMIRLKNFSHIGLVQRRIAGLRPVIFAGRVILRVIILRIEPLPPETFAVGFGHPPVVRHAGQRAARVGTLRRLIPAPGAVPVARSPPSAGRRRGPPWPSRRRCPSSARWRRCSTADTSSQTCRSCHGGWPWPRSISPRPACRGKSGARGPTARPSIRGHTSLKPNFEGWPYFWTWNL